MKLPEALIAASLMGVFGIGILFFKMNNLCGTLGLASLLSYTLAYTPLKQVTSFSVLVGAFPGAIPPMIGWAAASGEIGMGGFVLFAIQFIWQFPHFWAIAWVLDDDYKRAGFKMLPATGNRDRSSAFQILVYSIGLIPVSLVPVFFNMSGYLGGFVVLVSGVWFAFLAARLYKSCDLSDSKKIMFASFLYLPIIQLALIVDKI
jgi:protoheme IX farnesyltransferase